MRTEWWSWKWFPHSRLRFTSGVHVWDARLECARLGHVVFNCCLTSRRQLSLIIIVGFEGWWSNIFLCEMWFPLTESWRHNSSKYKNGCKHIVSEDDGAACICMLFVYYCTECLTYALRYTVHSTSSKYWMECEYCSCNVNVNSTRATGVLQSWFTVTGG